MVVQCVSVRVYKRIWCPPQCFSERAGGCKNYSSSITASVRSLHWLSSFRTHPGQRRNPSRPRENTSHLKMKASKSVSDVRRFINQLGKFPPKIAESQGIREWLHSDMGSSTRRIHTYQGRAYQAYYTDSLRPSSWDQDICRYTIIWAWCSSTAEGGRTLEICGLCIQVCDRHWKKLCTDREEALATTWACKIFATYVLGWQFTIESDHKPLISLLNE